MENKHLEFGNKLREIRLQKNLTQTDIEGMSFISKKTISRLENGKEGEPSIYMLVELSNIYNVDLLALYTCTIYESLKVLEDIQKSLDINAMFLDHKNLDSLLKRLDMIEEDKDLRNKRYEIELTKIFIEAIKNKNIDKFKFIDKFDYVSSPYINSNNILNKVYNSVELRLLINICNRLESYKGISNIKILNLCMIQSSSVSYFATSSNNLANIYYKKDKFDLAIEILERAIIACKKTKTISELSYLYYTKFLCLYRKSDNSYQDALTNAIVLADCSNTRLYKLITEKSKAILEC